MPDEHKHILDAALLGDAKKATLLLRQHIERTGLRNVVPLLAAAEAQARSA